MVTHRGRANAATEIADTWDEENLVDDDEDMEDEQGEIEDEEE